MKCTLLITRHCNLRCSYCYVGKNRTSMSTDIAERIVDLTYSRTAKDENLDFAFFGGEPLLEFAKVQAITGLIKNHPRYDPGRVNLSLVSNGTIFNDKIAQFLYDQGITFGISCDGPAEVHDRFRRFRNGKGSSARVESTIRSAIDAFSNVMINAVYRPETVFSLPDTVQYFSRLGVRQIYLSPDYSARWNTNSAQALERIYNKVSDLYISYYRQNDPHFISLIDSKIAVILRGGYLPNERCQMGRGEMAFTPDGDIYPCERLVGNDAEDHTHGIGNLETGIDLTRLNLHRTETSNTNSCLNCSLRDYCMNWCGCSNYFGSGRYNQVPPILCASERAAISNAFRVYRRMEKDAEYYFYDHASGSPLINSMSCSR